MANPITLSYNNSIYRNYTNYQNRSIVSNENIVANKITQIRSTQTGSAIRNNKYNPYNNLFNINFPETSIDQIFVNQVASLARRGYFMFFEYSKKEMFYRLQNNLITLNVLYFSSGIDSNWFNIDNWYSDQQLQNKAKRLPTISDHVIINNSSITNSTNETINIQSLELYNSIILTDIIANFLVLYSTSIQGSIITGSTYLYGTSSIDADSTINGPAILNDTSSNNGLISGNTIFYNSSTNNGTITANVEFNEDSINNSPVSNITGIVYCNTNGQCESKGSSNSLILNENTTINVPDGETQYIGSIINTNQLYILIKTGGGNLVINGPSQHSNSTIINQGKVTLENSGALGASNITINSGATLDLNNLSISNAIINNGGNILNAPQATAQAVINNAGSISEYTPPDECGTANIAGSYFDNLWQSCATWGPNGIPLWTSVGTNGGASFYGTYDQIGNVAEITDTIFYGSLSNNQGPPVRVIRGSDYRVSLPSIEARFNLQFGGDGQPENIVGFRIVCLNDSIQYASLMDNYNDFVEVGHPNNPRDLSSILDVTKNTGSVPYVYKITKYAITNYEYIKFLNSIDPDGINTDNVYHEWMNPENDIVYGAIEFNSDAPKGQKYSAKSPMANKPVVYVTWYEAARYCNWLHNNAPIYLSSYGNNAASAPHNYGAYDLSDVNNLTPENKKPLLSAKYRIQTSDEWYKAAYYEESNTFKGYHKYPTRSEKIVCVSSSSSGSGIIPSSCEPPDPIISQCAILSDIEESNNLYYFSGSAGDWDNLNHWWRDSSKTEQSPRLPTNYDDVYVLPGSEVKEQNIIYVANIIFDQASLKSVLFVGNKTSNSGMAQFKNFSSIMPTIDSDAIVIAGSVIFLNGSTNSGDISADNIKFFGNPIPKAYFPSPRAAYWHFCNGSLESANHINPIDTEAYPSSNSGNILGNVIFNDTCSNDANGIITGYNRYPVQGSPGVEYPICASPELIQKLVALYAKFALLYFSDSNIFDLKPRFSYDVKFLGYSTNSGILIRPNEVEFRPSSYRFDCNGGDILNGNIITFNSGTNSGYLCECQIVIIDQGENSETGRIWCGKNVILRLADNYGAIVCCLVGCPESRVLLDNSIVRDTGSIVGVSSVTFDNSSTTVGSETILSDGRFYINNYSGIGGIISYAKIIANQSPGPVGLRLFENPSWFYIPELDGTFWLNQIYYGNNQPPAEGSLNIFNTTIDCGPCTVHNCAGRICYDIADCSSIDGETLDYRPTSNTFGQCIPEEELLEE